MTSGPLALPCAVGQGTIHTGSRLRQAASSLPPAFIQPGANVDGGEMISGRERGAGLPIHGVSDLSSRCRFVESGVGRR